MENGFTLDLNKARDFLGKMFGAVGMKEADAQYCAECLIQTNLWGVDSHGILRAPIYLERAQSKAVNPTPDIKEIKGAGGPASLIDGDNGMGYVVAKRGMELAIEKAEKYGIGYVLARNSNHFGAAALYTKLATQKGYLGIATTNVTPNIGMKGNKAPCTGNNPLAVGAPLFGDFDFSLDISMSSVSGGKLLLAANKGEKIPKDWAVTKEGRETDDPKAGFEGFLLPMGLHKGFGLSLFIDVMTGLVGGGPYLKDIRGMYKHRGVPSLTSHLFMAINPGFFMPEDEFKVKMKDWAGQIHNAPMVNPDQHQIIPGEIEKNLSDKRSKEGLEISQELKNELMTLAEKLGVSADLLK